MANQEKNSPSAFLDVFFSKLKEQSFIIILMIGVIYYQHRMMEERVRFWQQQSQEKEDYIEQVTLEEKNSLLKRCNYLQSERDKYATQLIELKKNNQISE
jgi:hypothetical protein